MPHHLTHLASAAVSFWNSRDLFGESHQFLAPLIHLLPLGPICLLHKHDNPLVLLHLVVESAHNRQSLRVARILHHQQRFRPFRRISLLNRDGY